MNITLFLCVLAVGLIAVYGSGNPSEFSFWVFLFLAVFVAGSVVNELAPKYIPKVSRIVSIDEGELRLLETNQALKLAGYASLVRLDCGGEDHGVPVYTALFLRTISGELTLVIRFSSSLTDPEWKRSDFTKTVAAMFGLPLEATYNGGALGWGDREKRDADEI